VRQVGAHGGPGALASRLAAQSADGAQQAFAERGHADAKRRGALARPDTLRAQVHGLRLCASQEPLEPCEVLEQLLDVGGESRLAWGLRRVFPERLGAAARPSHLERHAPRDGSDQGRRRIDPSAGGAYASLKEAKTHLLSDVVIAIARQSHTSRAMPDGGSELR
jgi:hypothetical protein